MEFQNLIDISEDDIHSMGADILDILLFDRTTRRNIIWATSDYETYGEAYNAKNSINPELITGQNSNIIRPRVTKEKNNQLLRTKHKAEVFTPSWMCNIQNNLIDTQWFGRENVFNVTNGHTWKATTDSVVFPSKKGFSWKKYVDEKRLEITCGEAPYLVSRYDTVTGQAIPLIERIGLLDRKLRIINENADSDAEWRKWTKRAFESIYGFEYQGDSLLIARENMLFTFIDYYNNRFFQKPTHKEMREIAHIISWNIWQMDGICFTVPFQSACKKYHQMSDDNCDEADSPVFCKIRDWRSKETVFYRSLLKKERK